MTEKKPNLPASGGKIALVHDFLTSYGGAERVLQSMRKLYPQAPIYTLLADPEVLKRYFPGAEVRVSWLGKLPAFLRNHPRLLLLLFPAAIESFDLRAYDVVLSSSGAWSKGLVTRLHTRHIAYLHSPMRFAWDKQKSYLKDLGLSWPLRVVGRFALSYLRVWDFQAALRPDVLLSNSSFTAKRVAKYYRKESQVVYPGVLFPPQELERREREYFLVVSRLTKAKRVDIAIEAMNKLGLPLRVVGDGAERASLEKIAGKSISFEGKVDDQSLYHLYSGARAIIIPSEEDFGLVAVEALFCGTPVIAYGKGGAREIVEDGVSGLFFREPMAEILAEAILRFIQQEKNFERDTLRQKALAFSEDKFLQHLESIIRESVE